MTPKAQLKGEVLNLILSIVALGLGPLLFWAFAKSRLLRSSLEGFLFVTIAGVVVVHIIPEVFGSLGLAVVIFILAGVAFALIVDRVTTAQDGPQHGWIVLVGALGLISHAMMDGIALIPTVGVDIAQLGKQNGAGRSIFHGNHLALGVILHRIPVGMALWWAIRPRLGPGAAILALTAMAGATAFGYLLGEPALRMMHAPGVGYFQGFVAGTLLHVIIFSTVRTGEKQVDFPNARYVSGERLGVVVGLFLIFLIPHAR